MDGHIGFESEEGQGSTFWIELPLAEEQASVPLPEVAPAARRDIPKKLAPGRVSVLYVEDNPVNVRLMQEIIDRIPAAGMLSAHNAEFGLELAEEHRPDVIIMDINLPDMDGFAALERIRASECLRDTPVIALSANAMPDDIERGIAAGFHSYLTKPVRVDGVYGAITSALEKTV
jgi:CheY-like chemotaxis protein